MSRHSKLPSAAEQRDRPLPALQRQRLLAALDKDCRGLDVLLPARKTRGTGSRSQAKGSVVCGQAVAAHSVQMAAGPMLTASWMSLRKGSAVNAFPLRVRAAAFHPSTTTSPDCRLAQRRTRTVLTNSPYLLRLSAICTR